MFIVTLVNACATLDLSQQRFVTKTENLDQLHARFYGASTVLFSDGKTTIMIDGFLTRRCPFKHMRSDMSSSLQNIQDALSIGEIDKIDSLLISHAHFDHIMDSVLVANETKAELWGSPTSARVLSGANVNIIDPDSSLLRGNFAIQFYRTPHVEKSCSAKTLERWLLHFSNADRFKHAGDNYSFYITHPSARILVVPSSGFIANATPKIEADVVFLSIGLLGKLDDEDIITYWQQAVVETGAKIVIPIHWDNFFEEPESPFIATPSPADNLKKSMKILTGLADRKEFKKVEILFPPSFDAFALEGLTH